uniref:M4 family metallopeptidase n=1 Tax=uncultured Draconibacterium sp. TaxID=1573823 RepID=UPI003217C907
MKKYIKFLILIVLCFVVFNSNAQQNDTLKIERNKQGIVNFAHFKPNSERKIQEGTTFLKTFLHAKTDDDFRLIKETNDELGFSHLRFQQYYKGVKVENSEYLIHGSNGIIESINGDFKPVTLSSVKPSLNEKQALQKALNYVHAKKYKWEDTAYEKFKKENTKDANATYYPKGEPVIVKDYLTGSKQMKLAWKFTISSLEPYNEQWVYVDATNGEIVGDTPLLLNSNATGNAETLYSGTVGITCDSYSGGYRLYETRSTTPNHSVNVHTWNCLSQSNLTNAVEFSNTNVNWTIGNWAAISQDQAALDAHWAAEKVLDYWSTIHSRNSLDNQGLAITGYVHFYDPSSTAGWPNNAQWDGNNHVLKYGDGDGGTNFNQLVALDVVAHEMGHGIAQYTAGFSSTDHRQECDALNEGFSDIWGACVEDWATTNKQTWLSGEEFVNPNFTCLRDMQNPNSLTAWEGPHPDTYQGTFWDLNGEPHINSTVLSHWFYLLSEGSNGVDTNDNNDSFYVSGIGISDAQKIAFRAETNLNSSATFADARTQTILAAANLFGATSNQVIQTTNAWYAVGVGEQFSNYPISGPSYVCPNTEVTFTVNNAPPNYSWDYSPNLDTVVGNPGTFTTSFLKGDAWVSISVNEAEVGRKEFVIGSEVTGIDQISFAGKNRYYVSPACAGELNNIWILEWQGMDLLVDKPDTVYGRNYVDVVSTTNPNNLTIATLTLKQGGYTYTKFITIMGVDVGLDGIHLPDPFDPVLTFSPNPTVGETTISIEQGSANDTSLKSASTETTFNENAEWDLEVYDSMQSLKLKKQKQKGKSITINTQSWKEGVYMVRVKYKDDIITGKLVVKK